MQVRWVALNRRNVNRTRVGITLMQNTPNIDHPGFNKVRIQMRAAKASDPLVARVSDILTDFVEWLDFYGEKSWAFRGFFVGRCGDGAKELNYPHRFLGTELAAPMISWKDFFHSRQSWFTLPLHS